MQFHRVEKIREMHNDEWFDNDFAFKKIGCCTSREISANSIAKPFPENSVLNLNPCNI